MPVSPRIIDVGKCFITLSNQVRRVSKIENGMVFYATRNPGGPWNDLEHSVFLAGFADQVDREEPCDAGANDDAGRE